MRLHLKIATIAMMLAACEAQPNVPVDPVWGKQPCGHCAMLLSEPYTSAQLTTADGTREYFDDIGCLLARMHEHPGRAAHAWVHDEAADAWIPASRARYRTGGRTPMDSGLTATTANLPRTLSLDEVMARQRDARGGHHAAH